MKVETLPQARARGDRGYGNFDPDTLDNYLEALRFNLPSGFEHLRNHPYFNGTNPEVAYFNVKRRDTPLTLDERAEIGRKVRAAEKRINLVAEYNPSEEVFTPDNYLPDSLVRKDHDRIEYLIIGVVGPRAEYYGMELFKAIKNIVSNGSK